MLQDAGSPVVLKLGRLRDLLRDAYPEVTGMLDIHASQDPLGTLVLTLLSQSTTDRQAQAAYGRLRAAFSDWQAVLQADPVAVAEEIREGGLNHQKAARIQTILRRLQAEVGTLSLDWLREYEPGQAREFLESLPGVGPKTAACVLLFALGKPALPVDTHVARLARRLGLVAAKASPVQIQRELEAQVSSDDARHFHLALIEHGRSVCRPRHPRCGECPLSAECEYEKESLPR